MSDIVVDLSGLGRYATRIQTTKNRTDSVSYRISQFTSQNSKAVNWVERQQILGILNECTRALTRCRDYLEYAESRIKRTEDKIFNTDAANYKKKKGFFEAARDVFVGIAAVPFKVVKVVKKGFDYIADSYKNKGWVYKAIQVGKCVFKGAMAVGSVVGSIGVAVATGGLASPLAVAKIVSGVNNVINSCADTCFAIKGDYEKIGTVNVLKSGLETTGGFIGGLFGNEDLGKKIGNLAYGGMNVCLAIDGLSVAIDKVKKLPEINWKGVISDVKNISKIKIDGGQIKSIIVNPVDAVKKIKEIGKPYHEITNAVKKGKGLYDVGKKAKKVVKEVDKLRVYCFE